MLRDRHSVCGSSVFLSSELENEEKLITDLPLGKILIAAESKPTLQRGASAKMPPAWHRKTILHKPAENKGRRLADLNDVVFVVVLSEIVIVIEEFRNIDNVTMWWRELV